MSEDSRVSYRPQPWTRGAAGLQGPSAARPCIQPPAISGSSHGPAYRVLFRRARPKPGHRTAARNAPAPAPALLLVACCVLAHACWLVVGHNSARPAYCVEEHLCFSNHPFNKSLLLPITCCTCATAHEKPAICSGLALPTDVLKTAANIQEGQPQTASL